MKTKLELRFNESAHLRSADSAKRTIEGYAALFAPSKAKMGDYVETIRAGAFTKALKRSDLDCRMLLGHDPDKILGRTRSGTLVLNQDSVGLRFRCELPDTSLGRDVYTLIQRQDLSQCSFAFFVEKDDWSFDNNQSHREILEIREVLDCSVVAYPAYPDTSVSARNSLPRKAKTVGTYRHSAIITSIPVPPFDADKEKLRFRLRLATLGGNDNAIR